MRAGRRRWRLERRSRFLVLLANSDRRPVGMAERIGAALGGLDASLRRTATFDRGFEFMAILPWIAA